MLFTLASVGLSREKDVYICNTLKCRPPENRDPLPAEKEACRDYLDKQLEILKPRLIILCGRVALTSFLTNEKSISKIIMQNIAANLGGMLTPFGNPQNPFSKSGERFPFYVLSDQDNSSKAVLCCKLQCRLPAPLN